MARLPDCPNCGGELKPVGSQYVCKNCGSPFTAEELHGSAAPAAAVTTGASSAPSAELSGEQIYDKAAASTVEIIARSGNTESRGSGFVISAVGLIMSNAHVVLDGEDRLYEEIYVRYPGEEYAYAAHPIAVGRPFSDKSKENTVDLCLLFVEHRKDGMKGVEFGDSRTVKNGQKVYLVGNSLGEGTCITSGIISDRERAMGNLSYPYIMTDAAANAGNSGGPLFNTRGQLIGVLVAGTVNAKGMNYAIPVHIAEEFLRLVFAKTELGRVRIPELSAYATQGHALTLPMVFSGIKLLVDVVQYLINLCAH